MKSLEIALGIILWIIVSSTIAMEFYLIATNIITEYKKVCNPDIWFKLIKRELPPNSWIRVSRSEIPFIFSNNSTQQYIIIMSKEGEILVVREG